MTFDAYTHVDGAEYLIPIRPLHDALFIDIVDRNITAKMIGDKRLHLISDDYFDSVHDTMKIAHPGIRPRWARVLAVGPEARDDVNLGDLVLCDTLKWSRKIPLGRHGLDIMYFWRISVQDVLLINTESRGDTYLPILREKLSHVSISIGKY